MRDIEIAKVTVNIGVGESGDKLTKATKVIKKILFSTFDTIFLIKFTYEIIIMHYKWKNFLRYYIIKQNKKIGK